MAGNKKKVKGEEDENENIIIGARQILVSVQDRSRRQKHIKYFDEIIEANQHLTRGYHLFNTPCSDEVSTMSIGYIARAMGLNVSNEQVLRIVETIEDKDAASRGFVPLAPLRNIIIDALMTGVITIHTNNDTDNNNNNNNNNNNEKVSTLPSNVVSSIPVIRDNEETIYRAFRSLDSSNRGYLEADEMRHFLRSGAEPFTEEEVEEFIVAAMDPENGRIYYEDFADVLATE